MQGYMPRWSPDGRRIAFFGRLKTGLWKIFVVEAEGGLPEQVMEGGRNEADPGWSPDGNLLVFCRLPWQEPGGPASIALHMVDLTTREISTVPGSQGLYSPRWSPDGRHISAMDHASERLMLFDRTTQMWTELARADVGSASWSRDGKHLYFNTAGKDPAFVRVRVSDRKMETLASLAEIRYLTVWSGLAPDDSPLLVRDVGTQEIYALEWEVP
jgi:Tol biopolymer transport system component